MGKIEKLKDSVNHLVHDTNGAYCTIDAIIHNLRHEIEKGTLTNEYLIERLNRIEMRIKRITEVIDLTYNETRKSKLWEEHL